MAYRRFSDGRGLLSAQNISINFVLTFILNSGGKLWDYRLNKDNLEVKGIPETSFVSWALLD